MDEDSVNTVFAVTSNNMLVFDWWLDGIGTRLTFVRHVINKIYNRKKAVFEEQPFFYNFNENILI